MGYSSHLSKPLESSISLCGIYFDLLLLFKNLLFVFDPGHNPKTATLTMKLSKRSLYLQRYPLCPYLASLRSSSLLGSRLVSRTDDRRASVKLGKYEPHLSSVLQVEWFSFRAVLFNLKVGRRRTTFRLSRMPIQ